MTKTYTTKITSVGGGTYEGLFNDSKCIGSCIIPLKSGDVIENSEWDNERQQYNKILLNGEDVTKKWNDAYNNKVSYLKQWANSKKAEFQSK